MRCSHEMLADINKLDSGTNAVSCLITSYIMLYNFADIFLVDAVLYTSLFVRCSVCFMLI